MPTGTPNVQADSSGNHDFIFSWTNGGIAATVFQAEKGAQDLLAAQIKAGQIDDTSSVTVDTKANKFQLTINKSLLGGLVTVTVACNGTLAASADGKSTIFNMTNGTVDGTDGQASVSQVTDQLTQWAANWEKQAQTEPLQAKLFGRIMAKVRRPHFNGLAA